MPTTPSQLQFTQEIPTSVPGDTVPNPPVGSLILFAGGGLWYSRDSAGTVALMTGVSNVTATDTTITVTVAGTARTIARAAITGDVTIAAGSNAAVLPVVNANVGAFGSASSVATQTVNAKGQTTAAASVPIAIANTAVSGLGTLSTVSNLTGPVTSVGAATTIGANQVTLANIVQAPALTLRGNNTGSTANVTDLTLTQLAAMGIAGLTGWIDVTTAATPMLAANTGAQNITAINAILAAAANGSTIYIPKGIYLFNAAWTMPANKMFTFQGQGSNRAGSPATAYTELRWNANVGGDLITLPGSGGGWYTQFRDLTFTAITADQSAGAVVNVNGNVGTNFQNCAFQSSGAFFFDVLNGSGGSSNSWNSAVISNCNIQGYKGTGVRCNSSGSSLVIENSIIQGQWGGTGGTPAAAMAAAGISGGFVGAMQIIGCDILGNINNLLLNPVLASSEVCASVFVSNTYFDNSGGSCIKITGTGATVRADFTTCSFTTAGTNFTTPGTNLSALEIGGSFTFAAGGQNISFTSCNLYNTFGTTGTTNGVLINGTWADVYLNNCKVSGWTNGYNVTPSGVNISNLKVTGGACGPSGGYGLNTTGFNIAAGAYKGLQIQAVNAHGNTTNLTLGAVTVAAADASLFRITDNTGINPRGSVTTPGVPVAGATVTNITGFRVQVFAGNGATAPAAIVVNGVSTAFHNRTVTLGGNGVVLDPGGTIAFTTTTVAGWTWIAN